MITIKLSENELHLIHLIIDIAEMDYEESNPVILSRLARLRNKLTRAVSENSALDQE